MTDARRAKIYTITIRRVKRQTRSFSIAIGEIQEEVLRVFPETVTEVFTRKVWNKA